jgi:hypothetical protein
VQAFQNGLTYVIKRQIEFTKYASYEIDEAQKIRRPIHNLYDLTGNSDQEINTELNKALNQKTTEDDTHPSPVDRFRYIKGITSRNIPDDSSYIKDLFLNWDTLTTEMTTIIEKNMKK